MPDSMTDEFRRVLVIDDNESIHKDFEKVLIHTESWDELDALDAELFGDIPAAPEQRAPAFELTHAMQGEEGLQILREHQLKGFSFGCAFVDMRMPPGWGGVETIENLWKTDPDLQVVICTAYSDHSWEQITGRLGTTDRLLVLKKPFDEIEVVQLATSLCEKRRLLEISKQKVICLESTVGQQATELEAAHASAETLIQSLSSLLISLDENGRVSRWNRMATEILGIPESTAVGRRFSDLNIRWTNPYAVRSLVSNRSSIERCSGEVQFTDPFGQSRILEMRVCTIMNDPTSMARLIIATDITQQAKLQVKLDQAHRLKAMGQLAAGVANEIEMPIQSVGNRVRFVADSLRHMQDLVDLLPALIDDSVSDETMMDMRHPHVGFARADEVKSSIEQIPHALSDSIDGLEAISRVLSAMQDLLPGDEDRKTNVSLNQLLESTITIARKDWLHVAEIETDFAESLPEVPAHAGELSQALLNILLNAIHAIAGRVAEGELKKGKIAISTRTDGDAVWVAIGDNGGGIPASVRHRVYEPFFSTKDADKGSGQGLAFAQSVIMNRHDGCLDFDVEPGSGTTFHIRIPLAESLSIPSGSEH